MTIVDEINNFCEEKVSEINYPPDNFNISEIISYSEGDFKGIEITAFWYMDESEKDSTFPFEKHNIEVPENHELFDNILNNLTEIRNNINLKIGNTHSVSIRRHREVEEKNSTFESPFYDIEDSQYSSFSMVKLSREITEHVGKRIKQYVKQELQELDDSVNIEDIVQVECMYDDFKECDISSVSGYVVTENPHKYYSNVSSVDEYVDKIAENKMEQKSLKNQDNYHVYYQIDHHMEEHDENYLHHTGADRMFNEVMNDEISAIANINGEYMVEAESIIVKDYSLYPQHDDVDNHYVDYVDNGQERIVFFVRQPINDLLT